MSFSRPVTRHNACTHLPFNGETETNPNDYLGVFHAKTPIKDRLDFNSSLHKALAREKTTPL